MIARRLMGPARKGGRREEKKKEETAERVNESFPDRGCERERVGRRKKKGGSSYADGYGGQEAKGRRR